MAKEFGFYLKKLFGGSIILAFGDSASKLAALVLLPVFTHYLNPEDYGTLAMIHLVIAVLALIYNPGIISACRRYYYDTEDALYRQNIIGSGLLFFILLPIIFTLISLLFGDYLFTHIFSAFSFYPYGLIAVILALFTQPNRLWSILLSIKYRISRIAIVSFISVFLGLGISYILIVYYALGLQGRIVGMAVSTLFLFTIAIIDILSFTKFKASLKTLFSLLKFGSPLTIAIWSYTILDLADRYMLERMIGLASVGIYDVCYKIGSIPLFVGVGFNKMWVPIFYDNIKIGAFGTLKRLITLFNYALFIISLGILLFGVDLYHFFIDTKYQNGLDAMPWIIIGIYFLGLLPVFNTFLDYQKKYFQTSLIALFAATVNIVLNLFFIPLYGFSGAAMSTGIAYFVYLAVCMFMTRKDSLKLISIENSFPIVFLILILVLKKELPDFFMNYNIKYLFIKIIFCAFLVVFIIVIKRKTVLKLIHELK